MARTTPMSQTAQKVQKAQRALRTSTTQQAIISAAPTTSMNPTAPMPQTASTSLTVLTGSTAPMINQGASMSSAPEIVSCPLTNEEQRQAILNELIREKLIGKFNEPKCVNWLKFGGFMAMSVNLDLKQRCGMRLTKREEEAIHTCRFYSTLWYWLFVIVAVRQILLMFITSSNTQLWLGDMTQFWPGHRINYLLPSVIMSILFVAIFHQFKADENNLNQCLPFLSLNVFFDQNGLNDRLKYDNAEPITDHSAFTQRLATIQIFICIVASVLSGYFGNILIVTAKNHYDYNYGNYVLFSLILWMIVSVLWVFFQIYTAYTILAYYYLVTITFSERFRATNKEIEKLVALPDSQETEPRAKIAVRRTSDHIQMMNDADEFWRNIILFNLLAHFTCAGYMLYQIFFSHYGFNLKMFNSILLAHSVYQCGCYFYFSANMAWLLNLPGDVWTRLQRKRFTEGFRFQLDMVNFCFHHDRFGISCGDLFMITISSASIILATVTTSYLIATDFSQSNIECELCKH